MRRALLAKGLMSSSIQPTMLPPGPLSFGMTMTPAYGAAASSHIDEQAVADVAAFLCRTATVVPDQLNLRTGRRSQGERPLDITKCEFTQLSRPAATAAQRHSSTWRRGRHRCTRRRTTNIAERGHATKGRSKPTTNLTVGQRPRWSLSGPHAQWSNRSNASEPRAMHGPNLGHRWAMWPRNAEARLRRAS